MFLQRELKIILCIEGINDLFGWLAVLPFTVSPFVIHYHVHSFLLSTSSNPVSSFRPWAFFHTFSYFIPPILFPSSFALFPSFLLTIPFLPPSHTIPLPLFPRICFILLFLSPSFHLLTLVTNSSDFAPNFHGYKLNENRGLTTLGV